MQVNPVRISLVISCIAVSFLKCVDHTALRADYSLIAVPLCGTDTHAQCRADYSLIA